MPHRVQHDARRNQSAELLEYGTRIGTSILWSLALHDADRQSEDIAAKIERNGVVDKRRLHKVECDIQGQGKVIESAL